MPKEVMEIVQNRLKETAKDKKHQNFDASDMYLNDFKKNFGSTESRNSNTRANKPI